MKTFHLPDLGEGLSEAEVVEWHVEQGDEVQADQPLLAVETAKAVVEIPCPRAGRVARLYAASGDVVHVGDPLVEFDGDGRPAATPEPATDGGTVVGSLDAAAQVVREKPASVGGGTTRGVKATPAVRALAHRLDVDLGVVTPSGPDGLVTAADVQRVARLLAEVGPLQPLRGVRRAMARNMTQAHAEVVPVTLLDEADVDGWPSATDVSVRLIRALVAGCRAEPALNAWYDAHAPGRRLLPAVHLGVAVDSPDGLFVVVLRDVQTLDAPGLRAGLDDIKRAVTARQLTPERLRGYTITLSNFGTIAGRHATPVVLPPTVAILGAGRSRREPRVHGEAIVAARVLPLSLTFDHRAVTGGEAGRFLAAVIEDLERPD